MAPMLRTIPGYRGWPTGKQLLPLYLPPFGNSATRMHLRAMHVVSKTKRVIRGVVFDMDGTCTQACIDFAEMRRRAGVLEGDVLHVIDSWPADKRQQALEAIEEVEREALPKMQLMPGLAGICEWLDQQRIPRGLITRNSQASVDYFHKHHFTAQQAFLPALCRDFKPYKPSPAALLHICQEWRIQPSECLMVGDSAKDDVVSGNRAGAVTVLLDTDNVQQEGQDLQGEMRATYTVKELSQLVTLLQKDLHLEPPQERGVVGL